MIHIWTAAMIVKFKALCADDHLTFRDIRDLMNVEFDTALSRNACIGKARRLGMPPRNIANNPTLKKELPAVTTIFAPIPALLPPRSKEQFTTTIYQLGPRTCKWPGFSINDDNQAPFFYCGCRAPSGMPYCVEHTKRAHGNARPSVV